MFDKHEEKVPFPYLNHFQISNLEANVFTCLKMGICFESFRLMLGTRFAHFLVENQETGNERPGNFLQEIALFLENFLVLTIID